MKTQVRILFALAAAALLAGWLGLRRGNGALEAKLGGSGVTPAQRAQAQPDEAGPERAGDRGAQLHRAPRQEDAR